MIYNRTVQSITLIETSLSAGIWKCDCIAALALVASNIRLLTKAEIGEPLPGTHL
jgi:hypothetical protein